MQGGAYLPVGSPHLGRVEGAPQATRFRPLAGIGSWSAITPTTGMVALHGIKTATVSITTTRKFSLGFNAHANNAKHRIKSVKILKIVQTNVVVSTAFQIEAIGRPLQKILRPVNPSRDT
jgi:hypothetical protein